MIFHIEIIHFTLFNYKLLVITYILNILNKLSITINYFEKVGERFLLATEYNLKLNLLTLVSVQIVKLNTKVQAPQSIPSSLLGRASLVTPYQLHTQ